MKPKFRYIGYIIFTLLFYWLSRMSYAQEYYGITEPYSSTLLLKDTAAISSYLTNGKRLFGQKNDSAETVFYTALQSSKRLVFVEGVKKSLTGLANMYVSKGLYEDAIRSYENTIRFCQKVPALYSALPAMYNNLANVDIKQGNHDKAIAHYKQAIALMEKYKTNNAASLFNNLGGLLIQLQKYDNVPYYLDKAEAAAIAVKDSANLIAIYGNKGSYFFETGQWETSVFYAKRAFNLAEKINDVQMQFNTLLNLGELFRRGKQPEKALGYLLQAKEIKGNLLPYYNNHLFTILGSTYSDLKQYAAAESYFKNALKDALAGHLNKNIKKSYEGLAAVYEASGNYKASLDNYKAFRNMEDSMEKNDLSKSISEWDIKFRTSEKDRLLMQNQLELVQQRANIKNKNMWLIGVLSGTLLLVALMISFYRSNRHKRRLQAEQIHLLSKQQEIEQLKAIMKGEERERERMSRELHDGIGGMLAAVKMNLSVVSEKQTELQNRKQLDKVLQMLQDTSAEVRKTAHNLLPDVLTRHHLEEALMIYCEHINLSGVLDVQFQFHAAIDNLDKATELFLYRTTQELLQNIIKHAQATTAWLMIKELNNKLSIIVEDNGIGFDQQIAHHGYGLLNLQYRVKSLHGTVNITSTAERGTTVHIEFDLNNLKEKNK